MENDARCLPERLRRGNPGSNPGMWTILADMEVGCQISWRSVSGMVCGTVRSVDNDNCVVSLANGKHVIVNRKSINSNGKEKVY